MSHLVGIGALAAEAASPRASGELPPAPRPAAAPRAPRDPAAPPAGLAAPGPWGRRAVLGAAAAAAGAAGAPGEARASKVGALGDGLWEAMGGGPADLFFPAPFEGDWDVTSTLVSVSTPLGEDAVPDMRVVQRARQQELDQTLRYHIAFVRNARCVAGGVAGGGVVGGGW